MANAFLRPLCAVMNSLIGWLDLGKASLVRSTGSHFRRATLGLLIVVLAACDVLSPAATDPNAPPPPPELAQAEVVANDFLKAWTAGDYQQMYALISPRSQRVRLVDFSEEYAKTDKALGLSLGEGKSFEISKDLSQRQGSTAIIRYNVTFTTKLLGVFSDNARTMRLVLAEQGNGQVWRVAWSKMDIFEGLSGEAYLARRIVLPTRGAILDRNNQILAQSGVKSYAVRLLTQQFPGAPEDCYWKLNQVFRVSVTDAIKKYSPMVGLIRGFTVGTLSEEQVQALRPDLDSVCFLEYAEQNSRYYYGNSLAAQTVGYVGPILASQQANYPDYPDGALVGQLGIEASFEKELSGDPGARLTIFSKEGIPIRSIATTDPGKSKDVRLTIDRRLQLLTENAIANAYSYARINWAQFSPGAAAVVLDVKTGEVLAMASYPTFNADAFPLTTTWDIDTIAEYQRRNTFNNRVARERYAPASLFKVVSMAAATESKQFTPDTVFTCDGIYKDPEGITRYDWIYSEPGVKENFHGAITLKQALTSSCDDYFWHVGEKLYDSVGPNVLREYGNRLGLGVATGIYGIPEEDGIIPDPAWKLRTRGEQWGIGDTLSEVIGQGDVQVTPLQLARMLMAVSNGGDLYVPILVRSVGAAGEPPSYTAPQKTPPQLGFAKADLDGINAALCQVTRDTKLGTAASVFKDWDMRNISVCGKTGTSQNTQGEPPNAWFGASAGPAGKAPEIVVIVFVERSREGSEVAAPIARRIIESYYGLPYGNWPTWWAETYVPVQNPGEGGR